MSSNNQSREDHKQIVENLFKYVLQRKVTTDTEIDYWTDVSVQRKDFCWLLKVFGESDEFRRNILGCKTEFPNGHFYSPVVDVVSDIQPRRSKILGERKLEGLELRLDEQRKLFLRLKPHIHTIPFSDIKQVDKRYYYDNTSFTFGDAVFYWSMISIMRPRRIIEIGSGFTSALALDAIEILKLDTKCTFIDPYPKLVNEVAAPIDLPHEVIAIKIQDVSLLMFDELKENDILFIDSSHVTKTGSDVLYEITEIIPTLHPGVIIHFHDCFFPFEYPEAWIIEDNKSWNELYFLQAFLMFNNKYKILFFNDFFVKESTSDIDGLGLNIAGRIKINPGGGLWIRS